MIVRVLGEGQYDVLDADMEALNEEDERLIEAVDASDENAFDQSLRALLDAVRKAGKPVPEDQLVPSELVLPGAGTTIEEVRALLGEKGLIPG